MFEANNGAGKTSAHEKAWALLARVMSSAFRQGRNLLDKIPKKLGAGGTGPSMLRVNTFRPDRNLWSGLSAGTSKLSVNKHGKE